MRVLILNQAFYPDVVSSAQHAADLASYLAAAGHQVTVLASSHGYDHPGVRFPRLESWNGVRIVRLRCSRLGKRSRWRRIVDIVSFLFCCAACMLRLPPCDLVIAMSSPPLLAPMAALLMRGKARKLVLWILDLNPDAAIAAGWMRPTSLAAQLLLGLQSFSFRRAHRIIVLDRLMEQRLLDKRVPPAKMVVLPPWAHDDSVAFDELGRKQFRAQHGLSEKFVVMYSGNHSPCHPLDTLLQAAEQLRSHPRLHFCFVGGGAEFATVKAFATLHELSNVTCLPYQPRARLRASLSAGDFQVVTMGDIFPGIVHPCKVYNILTVGAPLLYIGPAESHVGDIISQLRQEGTVFADRHGEVELVVSHILRACQSPRRERESQLPAGLSQRDSLAHLLAVLQETVNSGTAASHGAPAGMSAFLPRAADAQE